MCHLWPTSSWGITITEILNFVPDNHGPKLPLQSLFFPPRSILQIIELFGLPAHTMPLWYYLYSIPCLEYFLYWLGNADDLKK